MSNLWEKEKKRIFRELYKQYLDEGYDHKVAKKLAQEEATELSELDDRFVKNIFNAEYGDD
jgi:hypothetical protein